MKKLVPVIMIMLAAYTASAQLNVGAIADTATIPMEYKNAFAKEQAFNPDIDTSIYFYMIMETDSGPVPYQVLKPISITEKKFASKQEEYDYNKMKKRVLTVYPYLLMAKELLAEIEEAESSAKKKKEFKKYKKSRYKELKDEFETELKNLTVKEGQILVSLVNRETGNSCYKLIKELKSGVTAFFWNIAANKYGYSLKEEYIAEDNQMLEEIITELEKTGEIWDIEYDYRLKQAGNY